jgi:SAM-dependent methyltransferase
MAGPGSMTAPSRASATSLPGDEVGALTLRRMASLERYNRWLHDRFDHYVGQRVLEIGSGIGNQTRYFADRERVIASDTDPYYLETLHRLFDGRANVRVASFRFPLDEAEIADLRHERIDSIVSLNVLEHIEDDRSTLRDCAAVLPSGGHLVLLVPSMTSLYGSLDRHLQHFRRYEPDPLTTLLDQCGFEVEALRFVNRLAVFGWWLNSRVLKRKVLPRHQLTAFRMMLPLLRLEEKRPPSFGLSLLALARRR